jgi:hypothetical protein
MRKIATLVIVLFVQYAHAQKVTVSHPTIHFSAVASPNPFTNAIKIVVDHETDQTVKTISIIDLMLKPVLEAQPLLSDKNEVMFDTTSLPSGYYFVKIESEKTERTIRVLKE